MVLCILEWVAAFAALVVLAAVAMVVVGGFALTFAAVLDRLSRSRRPLVRLVGDHGGKLAWVAVALLAILLTTPVFMVEVIGCTDCVLSPAQPDQVARDRAEFDRLRAKYGW